MIPILERLRDEIAAAISSGAAFDHDGLLSLCAELQDNPSLIPRQDAHTVIALIDDITALMIKGQADISASLRDIRSGREALKGYRHLRGAHTGQRLRREG